MWDNIFENLDIKLLFFCRWGCIKDKPPTKCRALLRIITEDDGVLKPFLQRGHTCDETKHKSIERAEFEKKCKENVPLMVHAGPLQLFTDTSMQLVLYFKYVFSLFFVNINVKLYISNSK